MLHSRKRAGHNPCTPPHGVGVLNPDCIGQRRQLIIKRLAVRSLDTRLPPPKT